MARTHQRHPTTVITYGTRNVGGASSPSMMLAASSCLTPNVIVPSQPRSDSTLSIPPRGPPQPKAATSSIASSTRNSFAPRSDWPGNLTRVEITSGLTEKDTIALSAINNRELSNGLNGQIVD
jgi:HlyD family secretion protein